MMHRDTIRRVKISRRVIETYVEFSDEYKRSLVSYYTTMTTVKPVQIDETGEVKMYIIKGILDGLNLDVDYELRGNKLSLYVIHDFTT